MGTLMKILNKNDSQGSKTSSGKEEVKSEPVWPSGKALGW